MEGVERDGWKQGFHRAQALGKKFEQAGGAHERLQAGALVEREWDAEDAQAFWVRKRREEELAEEAV